MEWLHGEEGQRSCSHKETTVTRLPFLYQNETTALATSFLALEGGTLNTRTVILYIIVCWMTQQDFLEHFEVHNSLISEARAFNVSPDLNFL